MKNSSQGKKLASNKYVDFKGGPAPKTIKANVQMPGHPQKVRGEASRLGNLEDLGKR